MSMGKRLSAEFLGTFWLVLGGCGSAVLAAKFGGDGNPLGIGFLGVALAFGLTVVTGAYAFGHISGAHFNPAVSVGLWAGGRFPTKDLVPYVIAQVAGGLLAGFILLQIASGASGFAIDGSQAGAFASNGYGALSPGGYSVAAAFLCEVVLTAVFLIVIMGSTHGKAPAGFAPLAIGLSLTLIHLISIPVTIIGLIRGIKSDILTAETAFHLVNGCDVNAQFLCDIVGFVSAQPSEMRLVLAQIEEQFSLCLGGGNLHDPPVLDDVFVNFRLDPMYGKRNEPHAHVWVEPFDRLHQANIAFLNQVRQGQAIAQIAACDMGYKP